LSGESGEDAVVVASPVVIPSGVLQPEIVLSGVQLDCLRRKIVGCQGQSRGEISRALQHIAVLIYHRRGASEIIPQIKTVCHRPRLDGADIVLRRCLRRRHLRHESYPPGDNQQNDMFDTLVQLYKN